jgi:hypothetical protein
MKHWRLPRKPKRKNRYMKTQYTWHRINSDVNGNPRYVLHWIDLGLPTYEEALTAARKVGGRKYHNKSFGGGIAFQSYSLAETEAAIQQALQDAA